MLHALPNGLVPTMVLLMGILYLQGHPVREYYVHLLCYFFNRSRYNIIIGFEGRCLLLHGQPFLH